MRVNTRHRAWPFLGVLLSMPLSALPASAGFQMILGDPASETVTGNPPAVSRPVTPMQRPRLPDAAECTATTRAGEPLSAFARRVTGQDTMWRTIADMNRLDDPDRIGVGWTLAYPCPAGMDTGAAIAAIQTVGARLKNANGDAGPDSTAAGSMEPTSPGAEDAPWSDEHPPSDADRGNPAVPARLRDAPVIPPVATTDGQTADPAGSQTDPPPGSTDHGIADRHHDGDDLLREAPDTVPRVAAVEDSRNSGDDPPPGTEVTAPAGPQGSGNGAPTAPSSSATEFSAVCSTTVTGGDTLSSIAARTLGDKTRWREIADLNRITNPDRILVGAELALPCGGTVTASLASPVPTPAVPIIVADDAGTAAESPVLPIWRAAAGDWLEDAITRWAWRAGYEPIQTERWFWRSDTDFEYQGTFDEALDQVLSGFPSSGTSPMVLIHANQVVTLEYR